ncbi:carbohydrate ABC transporter permease [Salana multivorans]|nr:sugar ABC transporter permease [Salana multivorans]OJX95982.1 MAG: ABC transporter permease [Micrococcales bacterium 73-15]
MTLAFAAPVVLVFGFFSWGPIVRGLVMGFQRTNLVDAPSWVGWANFSYVLEDPQLGQAVGNTAWFALLALVVGFPVPLFLAVFMAELRGARGLFNVLSYLPVVVPPVVAAMLWRFFYAPSADGVFNQILGVVGLGPYPWLNSDAAAMPAIVVEVTWATAGGTVIIYLAALTAVKTELYEAAELDGSGIWRRLWHVTLPQMRGIILVLLLLQLIGTLQIFNEPFIFGGAGGAPNGATLTLLMKIYNYAFVFGDFGAATALSAMLAVVLGLLSVIYLIATRKWSAS